MLLDGKYKSYGESNKETVPRMLRVIICLFKYSPKYLELNILTNREEKRRTDKVAIIRKIWNK